MTAQAAFAEFKNGDYKKRRREGAYERLKARVLSVLEPAIEAFGDERILVGSGASLAGGLLRHFRRADRRSICRLAHVPRDLASRRRRLAVPGPLCGGR